MNQVIQNVSDTAFLVAGLRGMETDRSDPLFRDPLAWKLASEHGRNILATVPHHFVGGWSVVIRTVIIDTFIRDAIAKGVDTVLNLGAGLDTRPYRMDLPKDLHWIEVDYPHVIDLKDERLADEADKLGRPMPMRSLMRAWFGFLGLFMSSARRQAMKRYVAYVLLVPK